MNNSIAYSVSFDDVEKYIEVRQFDKALETLKSIEPKNIDETANQLYLIGKIYYSLGKITRAEEFFSDANMKDPDNGKISAALANTKIGLGKFSEAKSIAKDVVEDDYNQIDAHMVLATIDERIGNIENAKNRFKKLIDLQPHSENIHVAYANFLDLRVDSNSALELLYKYIKRYPDSPMALNRLGEIYYFIGDVEKAIRYRTEAFKIYDNRGQKIYSNSIKAWLNTNEKIKLEKDKQLTERKKILDEEVKKRLQEEKAALNKKEKKIAEEQKIIEAKVQKRLEEEKKILESEEKKALEEQRVIEEKVKKRIEEERKDAELERLKIAEQERMIEDEIRKRLIEEDKYNGDSISFASLNPPSEIQKTQTLDPWPIDENDHGYTGSGFITNYGSHIITNKHVIENSKKLFVRNGLGELKKARVLRVSRNDDIAVLELETPFNSQFSQNFSSKTGIKPGQKVFVMGYPLSDILGENKPSISQGIVSKDSGMFDDPGFFQITAKLNSGNSGGPIFSKEGNILGIAVMKLDKSLMLQEFGSIPEDVNFGIPNERVEKLTNYSSSISVYAEELELEKLYESLLPSVVMILNVLDVKN